MRTMRLILMAFLHAFLSMSYLQMSEKPFSVHSRRETLNVLHHRRWIMKRKTHDNQNYEHENHDHENHDHENYDNVS